MSSARLRRLPVFVFSQMEVRGRCELMVYPVTNPVIFSRLIKLTGQSG
jgi:hypothetical protein